MYNRERNESVISTLWFLDVVFMASLALANSSGVSASCFNSPLTKLVCNNLTEMPVDQLNSNITHLHIEHSNIPLLSNDDLTNCSSLYELVMEFTNTKTIENEAFKELESLKYLTLKGNYIKTIHSVSFLSKLTYLDLSQNPLDFSENSPFPPDIKNVLTLYTSEVGMKDIVSAHPEGLESLITWRMMKNLLTSLKLEDFINLKNISSIDVEGNKIEVVLPLPTGVELKNVAFMDLSYNKLGSLDKNTFQGLPSLRELRLHDNPLLIPSRTPFLDHGSIEILILSRVHANTLSEETFKNLPQLTRIEMISSAVQNFTGAFVSLRQLRVLNLQNNTVEIVEAGTFADSGSLKYLVLNGGALQEFDPDALVNVTINGTVDISNTALACSMKCYDLEKWAMDNGVTLEDSCGNVKATCNSDEQCFQSERCCKDKRCSKQGVCCTSGTTFLSPCFVVFLLTGISLFIFI